MSNIYMEVYMTPFLQEGRLGPADAVINSNNLKNKKSFIYRSQLMDELIKRAHKVADLKSPVLIVGEQGVGKKLLALQIHEKSSRHYGPFRSIHCGSLAEQVLETELFGYKGDDTTPSKEGVLQKADGGTLVLEEIGSMPFYIQDKLMSFLKMGAITPVGSHRSMPVNVRIIYTTSDEKKLTDQGGLNRTFYNYIKSIRLEVPNLSKRKEDIPDLIRYFLSLNLNSSEGHRKKWCITEQAMNALKCYRWSGNVRELKDICERFQCFVTNNEITVKELPHQILNTDECVVQVSYDPTLSLADINRLYILSALKHFPSKKRAASALGITVKTLYNRLHEYGVFDRYAIHAEKMS